MDKGKAREALGVEKEVYRESGSQSKRESREGDASFEREERMHLLGRVAWQNMENKDWKRRKEFVCAETRVIHDMTLGNVI